MNELEEARQGIAEVDKEIASLFERRMRLAGKVLDYKKGNGWKQRCPVVCAQINFQHPDVLGTQEVLAEQLDDMKALLTDYDYIGVGRDDGKRKGEHTVIFYDRKTIRLLQQGHFWLSETPDKPGLGWDAACTRICTWGKFRSRKAGKTFCRTECAV